MPYHDNYHTYRFTSNVEMIAELLALNTLNTYKPPNNMEIKESPRGCQHVVKQFIPISPAPVQFTQSLNRALRAARRRPNQKHRFFITTFNSQTTPFLSFTRITQHEIPKDFTSDNIIYNKVTGDVRFVNRGLNDMEKRMVSKRKKTLQTLYANRQQYERSIEHGICSLDSSAMETPYGINFNAGKQVTIYNKIHPLFRGVPFKDILPTRHAPTTTAVNDYETCIRVKPAHTIHVGMDPRISLAVSKQAIVDHTYTHYDSSGLVTRTKYDLDTPMPMTSQNDSMYALLTACFKNSKIHDLAGGGITASSKAIQSIFDNTPSPPSLIRHTIQYFKNLPKNENNANAFHHFLAVLEHLGHATPELIAQMNKIRMLSYNDM